MGMKLEEIERLLKSLYPQDLHSYDNIVYIDGDEEIVILANGDVIKGEIICVIDYAEYHSQDVALARLIAAAPTVIRELVERVKKLELVKEQAQEIISWADGKEAYSGEVEIDSLLISNIDHALAALKEST